MTHSRLKIATLLLELMHPFAIAYTYTKTYEFSLNMRYDERTDNEDTSQEAAATKDVLVGQHHDDSHYRMYSTLPCIG